MYVLIEMLGMEPVVIVVMAYNSKKGRVSDPDKEDAS